MSVPDLEVQRSRAFKQLSAARDRKLTMGRGEPALAALNAADQLIESIPELKELRAEIAYRKGHLLLRTAVSPEDLQDADSLFALALRSETRLAPWARVYRVAILGRLLALDATEQRKRNLEQGRKLACAAVKDAIKDGEGQLKGAGRVLIRPSGTEPVIRVMAEGEDAALVTRVVDGIAQAIARAAG